MWGSRLDVNLHHPQTATAGETSGPGTAIFFFFCFKAKLEFKATVHYGLWAKCTQLWPRDFVKHAGHITNVFFFFFFFFFLIYSYVLVRTKYWCGKFKIIQILLKYVLPLVASSNSSKCVASITIFSFSSDELRWPLFRNLNQYRRRFNKQWHGNSWIICYL